MEMNRRKFVIGMGTVSAAAVGGTAFAGNAAADVDGELTITEGNIEVSNHDGAIEDIVVEDATVDVTYDNFNEGTTITATFQAERLEDDGDDNWRNIGELELTNDSADSGSESAQDDLSLFDGDTFEANEFDAEDDDGGENRTELDFQATVSFDGTDHEDIPLVYDGDPVEIVVENQEGDGPSSVTVDTAEGTVSAYGPEE